MFLPVRYGRLAQSVRAPVSHTGGRRFESSIAQSPTLIHEIAKLRNYEIEIREGSARLRCPWLRRPSRGTSRLASDGRASLRSFGLDLPISIFEGEGWVRRNFEGDGRGDGNFVVTCMVTPEFQFLWRRSGQSQAHLCISLSFL